MWVHWLFLSSWLFCLAWQFAVSIVTKRPAAAAPDAVDAQEGVVREVPAVVLLCSKWQQRVQRLLRACLVNNFVAV